MLKFYKFEYFHLSLILCIASFLLFWNLGNQYLWQDEAQTALVSKTILDHGIPLGHDGKNSFSQELGAEFGNDYIWKWHTWFPFYLLALFFKTFGINTFIARLPFALCGLGTVFITYLFSRSLFKDQKAAIIACILLLISVPFLVLSRQCRYYTPTMLFSLLGLYSYYKIYMEQKRNSAMVFIVSITLLFHTHYIYFAIILSTIFIHTLIFHRDKVRRIFFLSIISVGINIPWIVWFSSMKYTDAYGSLFNMQRIASLCRSYILQTFTFIFPPFLLAIPIISSTYNLFKRKPFFSRDKKMWEAISLLCIFLVLNIVVLSLCSPGPFFRYLSPVIPAAIIIMTFIVICGMKMHTIAGVIIIAVLIFTGSLKDFFYEITHDYDGPVEGMVKYLDKHGSRDDTVVITYGDMPLKFYTDMRILGGLTGEDLSPSKDAEWIILRKHTICEKDFRVKQYLINNLKGLPYQKSVIDYPDIPFENREDPVNHRFKTSKDVDKVIIYKRVEN